VASFIRNPKDFWSGVIFMFFGLAAMFIGQDYAMGSAGRMGPAYFPTILGGMLTLVGLIATLRSLFGRREILEKFAFKGAFLVLLGSALFGILVRNAGLVPAVMTLVMLGGYASTKFRFAPYVALAAGMTIFCVLVFAKGLGLPMPLLGPWFGY